MLGTLLKRRDGKNMGRKMSLDNGLRHSMPSLFRRFPGRHGRTSMSSAMVSAVVVRVDSCR
jgi:hypothetical protein